MKGHEAIKLSKPVFDLSTRRDVSRAQQIMGRKLQSGRQVILWDSIPPTERQYDDQPQSKKKHKQVVNKRQFMNMLLHETLTTLTALYPNQIHYAKELPAASADWNIKEVVRLVDKLKFSADCVCEVSAACPLRVKTDMQCLVKPLSQCTVREGHAHVGTRELYSEQMAEAIVEG